MHFFSIFSLIIENIVLISRALRHQFIIPDFEGFTKYIDLFFDKVKEIDAGKVRKSFFKVLNIVISNQPDKLFP